MDTEKIRACERVDRSRWVLAQAVDDVDGVTNYTGLVIDSTPRDDDHHRRMAADWLRDPEKLVGLAIGMLCMDDIRSEHPAGHIVDARVGDREMTWSEFVDWLVPG